MAAKRLTATKRAVASRPRVTVPTIRNVMEIKAPVKEGTLLHFTAAQWKQAISRIPVGRRLPKQGMFLEAYPIPDGDVLAQPDCVPGPCEICRVRMVPGRDGLIAMDCQCRRDPNCPPEPSSPPPSVNRCRLAIGRIGGSIRIFCENQGCTSPRGCRLTAVRTGGRYIITCACG
jgi:hypothetical protein